MAEPYLGQITIFGGNFAPKGWALCNGQLLPIDQNQALFSVVGTTYGGDGRTAFALPDLRGRVPIHAGASSGLSARRLGQQGGAESVTLTTVEMPSHNHAAKASNDAPNAKNPQNALYGSLASAGFNTYTVDSAADLEADSTTIANTGGSLPHDNVQPYSCLTYIIALEGVFPSRS